MIAMPEASGIPRQMINVIPNQKMLPMTSLSPKANARGNSGSKHAPATPV
jgi:hypothetical protein